MRAIHNIPARVVPVLFSAALLLLAACTPDTLIVLDPVLAATSDNGDLLTRKLAETVRVHDRRPKVTVLDSVSADRLREAVALSSAQIVIAPALLSGPLVQAAGQFPDRRFYLLGSEADTPVSRASATVYPVPFDRIAAFETAGEAAVRAADGEIVGMFLVNTPRRAREMEAFVDAAEREFESRGVDPNRLTQRRFESVPDAGMLRDAVTGSLRDTNEKEGTVFAFFLGIGNVTAWEALGGGHDLRIITEAPLPMNRKSPQLLGWIENRWSDAVRAALLHANDGRPDPPVAAARFFHGATAKSGLNLMMNHAED